MSPSVMNAMRQIRLLLSYAEGIELSAEDQREFDESLGILFARLFLLIRRDESEKDNGSLIPVGCLISECGSLYCKKDIDPVLLSQYEDVSILWNPAFVIDYLINTTRESIGAEPFYERVGTELPFSEAKQILDEEAERFASWNYQIYFPGRS